MRVLVTAGPTREAIDPVRFISNRSSGRMGYAVAAEAARRGHEVVLVSGPVCLDPPGGVEFVQVVSAAQMHKAVMSRLCRCHAVVMAAAVADWRPRKASRRKLKKAKGAPVLELEPTADILAAVCAKKRARVVVGFAAETHNCLAEGRRKLQEKGADMVVVNDVSRPDSGFDVEHNKVTFLYACGAREDLPLMRKSRIAARIIDWMESRTAGHGG